MDYGDNLKLEIITTKKYNNKEWVNVKATRYFDGATERGGLDVNVESIEGSPVSPINYTQQPDLSSGIYYLGGIPPGFMSGSTKAPGAEYAFLGCTKDIQINSESVDPLLGQYHFGIEAGCKDRIVTAAFTGKGFMELAAHSLRRHGSFAFSFQTTNEEALLLMATVPPSSANTFDGKERPGFYSVAILNGKLSLKMDAGEGVAIIESKEKLNNGKLHIVTVFKRGREIQLRVDDIIQGNQIIVQQPNNGVTLADEDGGLYLGGFPDYPEYLEKAPTSEKLYGIIGNLVFNNQTIYFENFINFTNVQMGRSITAFDSTGNFKTLTQNFKPNQDGCQKVSVTHFGINSRLHNLTNITEFYYLLKKIYYDPH